MKVCSNCGATKPLGDFYTRKDSKDGHRGTCKVCVQNNRKVNKWGKQVCKDERKHEESYSLIMKSIEKEESVWKLLAITLLCAFLAGMGAYQYIK